MSQTSYTRDRAVAVPGMVSEEFDGNFVVSYPASEDIPPGRVVELVSGRVRLPQATTLTKPVGVSCFSPTNQQPGIPAAGFVYKAGDMVPVLRRGRIYAETNGGSPAELVAAKVNHSSTTPTHRGKVSDAAASAGAGTEITASTKLMYVSAGPTGSWLIEVDFFAKGV